MKQFLLTILLIIFVLDGFSQSTKLIVVGIDGLGSYGIIHNNTPNIDALMNKGSYTLHARAVMPTLSNPNWASILMGVTPNEHEIRSNQWRREHISQKQYCSGEIGSTYPTIFKVYREADPNAKIVVFNQWKELDRLLENDIDLLQTHFEAEDSLIKNASVYINSFKPELVFLHLDLVDHAGHHYGLQSKEYRLAVEKTDRLIGKLLQDIQFETSGEYTIIVTADHGFRGRHHGGIGKRLRHIPWIAVGRNIKANYKIQSPVNTYDTAPTIANILTIAPIECWKGKALKGIMIPDVAVEKNKQD